MRRGDPARERAVMALFLASLAHRAGREVALRQSTVAHLWRGYKDRYAVRLALGIAGSPSVRSPGRNRLFALIRELAALDHSPISTMRRGNAEGVDLVILRGTDRFGWGGWEFGIAPFAPHLKDYSLESWAFRSEMALTGFEIHAPLEGIYEIPSPAAKPARPARSSVRECSRCHDTSDDFSPSDYYCRPCRRAYSKAWDRRNTESAAA